MKFRHELSYDADPDQVFAMLADPTFREAVCAAQDVISADVDLTPREGGFSLRIDQLQKTDDLPGFARTFAGDSTQAIQIEEWDDPRGATLVIEAPGKPSDVRGTISLDTDGTGTREVVELEIRVKIPVLGGKLEKLLAEKVRQGMDTEHEVGVVWLAGEN